MPPSNTRAAGELHLSGTRNATFIEECERKWAWQHIAGHKTAETDAHRFGTRFHRVGELYLGAAVAIDRSTPEGALYLTGVHLWPAPGHGKVEQAFQIPAPGGQLFTGTKDYVKDIADAFPGFEASRGIPGVGDYKTTKSIEAYAPDADKLRRGTQFTTYVHHEIELHGAKKGAGRWVYYDKSVRRKAYPVDVVLTRDEAAGAWHEHEDAMGRMVDLWQRKADPLSLRPRGRDTQDYEACERYGGCQFKHLCAAGKFDLNQDPGSFITKPQKGARDMSTGVNSKLFAKFAIASAPAAAAASPQDEAPTINPPPIELTPEAEALVQQHEAEIATVAASKAAAKAPKATKPVLKAAQPSAAAIAAASTMVGESADGRDVLAVAERLTVGFTKAAQPSAAALTVAANKLRVIGDDESTTIGTLLDAALAASQANSSVVSDELATVLKRIDELEGRVNRLASLFRDV